MFNVYSYSNPIKQKLWKNYFYFNNHDVSSLFKNTTAQGTIVDVAVGNEDFSTLVTALKAAGLVGAKQKDRSLFSPHERCFAKIDSKTLNSTRRKNQKALANIPYWKVNCNWRCSCFKEG
jgi:uncharacterized surface protein with fasciclin (FAS1) repeats